VSQPSAESGDRPAAQRHYFTTPQGAGRRRTLQVTLAGRDVEMVAGDGVFSGHRLDLGTRVLLREVPAPPATGHLLDLGCGWGALAVTQALSSPGATVWAVDVNDRALELTAENARRLGLRGVRAVHPDDVPDDVTFAAIWSNPPIRVGKGELHDLLLRWLPRMTPDGEAYLVVQRNLGADSLHAWLQTQQADGAVPGRVSRCGSAKGFRVLRVGG
jgi:16S rRNA G1207 methylase RsmC